MVKASFAIENPGFLGAYGADCGHGSGPPDMVQDDDRDHDGDHEGDDQADNGVAHGGLYALERSGAEVSAASNWVAGLPDE